jgi:hypothetical protein
MTKTVLLSSVSTDYLITCSTGGISIRERDRTVEQPPGDQAVRVPDLTTVSLYSTTWLMCSLDTQDMQNCWHQKRVLDGLVELAAKPHSYQSTLPDLDFRLIGASYFSETILGTVRNPRSFLDLVVRHREGDHLFRVYLGPPVLLVGIQAIDQYHFLSGQFPLGYEGAITGTVLSRYYQRPVNASRRMTVTNGSLNRTLLELEGGLSSRTVDGAVRYLVLEWRPVLYVHQYYYELYGLVEYYQESDQCRQQEDLFWRLLQSMSQFRRLMAESDPSRMVRIPMERNATSMHPVDPNGTELIPDWHPNLCHVSLTDWLEESSKTLVQESAKNEAVEQPVQIGVHLSELASVKTGPSPPISKAKAPDKLPVSVRPKRAARPHACADLLAPPPVRSLKPRISLKGARSAPSKPTNAEDVRAKHHKPFRL